MEEGDLQPEKSEHILKSKKNPFELSVTWDSLSVGHRPLVWIIKN